MRAALSVALGLLAPVAGMQGQGGRDACPAGPAEAEIVGPRVGPADSGRIYSYTLSPDGREFYFFKKVGDLRSEDYRIFRAVRQGNAWSTPEQLRLGVDASDLYPTLSADGMRLAFASYRAVPGDTSAHPNAHIYLAFREGGGWGTPTLVGASRIGYYHSGLRLQDDGSLTFRLTTPDWRSGSDMRLAWNGRSFAEAMTPAATGGAAEYWRARSGDSVHVWGALSAPNGASLVQVSRIVSGRRAPADYFASVPLPGGGWTPLVRAGGGMSEHRANFAWFSSDGCWLHFTSDYSRFMRVSAAAVGLTRP